MPLKAQTPLSGNPRTRPAVVDATGAADVAAQPRTDRPIKAAPTQQTELLNSCRRFISASDLFQSSNRPIPSGCYPPAAKTVSGNGALWHPSGQAAAAGKRIEGLTSRTLPTYCGRTSLGSMHYRFGLTEVSISKTCSMNPAG